MFLGNFASSPFNKNNMGHGWPFYRDAGFGPDNAVTAHNELQARHGEAWMAIHGLSSTESEAYRTTDPVSMKNRAARYFAANPNRAAAAFSVGPPIQSLTPISAATLQAELVATTQSAREALAEATTIARNAANGAVSIDTTIGRMTVIDVRDSDAADSEPIQATMSTTKGCDGTANVLTITAAQLATAFAAEFAADDKFTLVQAKFTVEITTFKTGTMDGGVDGLTRLLHSGLALDGKFGKYEIANDGTILSGAVVPMTVEGGPSLGGGFFGNRRKPNGLNVAHAAGTRVSSALIALPMIRFGDLSTQDWELKVSVPGAASLDSDYAITMQTTFEAVNANA